MTDTPITGTTTTGNTITLNPTGNLTTTTTTNVPKPADKPAFPADTPVADMEPGEQAAYWRDKAQKHEKAWRGKVGSDLTPEQYAAEHAELEQLRDTTRTDTEKAIAQAKKEARAEVEAEYAPRLVTAAFTAALSKMNAEDRNELLDTINPAKFLTPNGELDTDKVGSWIKKYVPQSDTGVGTHTADHGGGRRTTTTVSPRDAGLAEARKRFPPKATA